MDVRFDSSIRRRALGSLLVGAVALLNQSALGQSAESHPSIHADQLQLPNGSILVTEVDRAATGVAICAVFRTGTRDDPADHPGLADAVARGAAPEGTSVQVSADFTRFCAEVPSVDLARELSRWRAAFNPESALGSARPEPVPDAGAPFFGAPAKLFELALEGHAYEHARTGLVGGRLDADSARDFRAARYQPDALAFGIVGNFDSSRVTDLVAAAFGAESHRTLGRASVSALARQTSERFAVLHVAAAQRDAAVQGWVIPASETPPHRALEVAAAVLSDSSKGMEASVAGLVDPDVFEIRVTAPRGANRTPRWQPSTLR